MVQAVQFSTYGDPEVLELVDVDAPEAGPGQVRIAVRAAGVNPYETKVRAGAMASEPAPAGPTGLGSDVAGTVDQVGAGVTAFAVGDDVLGSSSTPSYAQYALADPVNLVARPASILWAVAGGIGIAGRTAYRVLAQLQVQAGETLLVHGAAGGVGTFAVQLARARGARVIGTASESNHELLRGWGVIPVVYGEGLQERVRAVAPEGVDAVFDTAGRGVLPESIALAGGPERVITIADGDASKYGARFSGGDGGVDVSDAFPEIVRRIAAGTLKVPVWRTYPLAQAAAAHRESEGGHLQGKIVLVVE